MQITRRSLMAGLLPFQLQSNVFNADKSQSPPTALPGVIDASVYPTLQAAADIAFGPVSNPHGTNGVLNNKVLWIPPGIYRAPSPGLPVLDLKYLHGGRIIGAGRFVTKLIQDTPGVPVIRTNGCGYSHFEGMLLQSEANGTCFNLDWDGTSGGAALQSNTFEDVEGYGGAYGIKIGESGFMGSENLFQNCFWLSNQTAGLATLNHNALQQTIIGGNFQGCGKSIWVALGSVPTVHGVGFQQSTVADIQIETVPSNAMSVAGCRTESPNFIINNGGQSLHISACSQRSFASGRFLSQAGGRAVISACESSMGNILAKYWAQIRVENCGFNREDWLEAYQPWWIPNNSAPACVEAENVDHGANHIKRRRFEADRFGYEFNKVSDYVVQPI